MGTRTSNFSKFCVRALVAFTLALVLVNGCGGSGLVRVLDIDAGGDHGADAQTSAPPAPSADIPDDGTDAADIDATEPSGSSDATSPDTSLAPDDSASTPVDAGPPSVTFSLSPTQITEGQSVTFRATVVDPLGPANLATNELRDDQGGYYGSLAPAGSPSAFVLTLSWAQLNQVREIAFSPPGAPRNFIAQFANLQAKTTSATAALTLACGNAHSGACVGVCTDFWADASCGGCGKTCGVGVACQQGSCIYARWSACLPRATTNVLTCAEQCQDLGKTCTTGCTGCGPGQACEAQTFVTEAKCQAATSPTSSGSCSNLLPTAANGNTSFRCCCI